MTKCPVCVFTATNISPDTLRGFKCFNCGCDLSEHPLEQRENVDPGRAFAVNPEELTRYPA